MSGLLIAVPRHQKLGRGFSRGAQAQALLHPGRRIDGTQSAATWVSDWVDRRQVVIFCTYCRPKFNPRKHGYRRFYCPDHTGQTSGYLMNGICEGCRQKTALLPGGGTGFIAEEAYALTCIDPSDARRRARAAAGATTAWDRIRSFWSGSRAPVEGSATQETIHA